MDNNIQEVNLEHLRQLAYRAHYFTSFSPDKRADETIRVYGEELRNDLQEIRDKSSKDILPDNLEQTLTRYQQKYEKHLSDWLHSHSNVASSAVTGPANFPVARMEKYRKWADNKYEYFREWRQRALKAIVKAVKPNVNELEQARENLKKREEMQQLMISANKIIRKGGTEISEELKKIGLDEKLIHEILNPVFTHRKGFLSFQLSNNNAEIHRLRSRVTILEAKAQLADTKGKKIEEVNGIKLVHDYEADRVQLLFEGKPDPETITQLKSNGFRWTPSQKAWQRKLTNRAIEAAQGVAKGISR
ncbi:MAG: hypothetical protein KF862_04090 [Chitinophagaceae bacterium]|nr:hypothetical protein [Chitinophagaceae bacterium]